MAATPRLATLAVAALVAVVAVEASGARIHRVAVLSLGAPDDPTLTGLRDGLKAAGFVEGKNLVVELAVKASEDELRPVAQAYGNGKVDALVTIGDDATTLARESAPGTSIVSVQAIDPLRHVGSLSHPQGNVTGVMAYIDDEMQGKRLEVFKQTVPGLRRVIVLYAGGADRPRQAGNLAALRSAGPRLRVMLVERSITSAADVIPALAVASSDREQGIFIVCSGVFNEVYGRIAAVARQRRLPLTACTPMQVAEQGGLLLYAPDSHRLGEQSAQYVARILKGTRPGQLPVAAPAAFELTLNLKTAREIGITIPPGVLMLADHVIK